MHFSATAASVLDARFSQRLVKRFSTRQDGLLSVSYRNWYGTQPDGLLDLEGRPEWLGDVVELGGFVVVVFLGQQVQTLLFDVQVEEHGGVSLGNEGLDLGVEVEGRVVAPPVQVDVVGELHLLFLPEVLDDLPDGRVFVVLLDPALPVLQGHNDQHLPVRVLELDRTVAQVVRDLDVRLHPVRPLAPRVVPLRLVDDRRVSDFALFSHVVISRLQFPQLQWNRLQKRLLTLRVRNDF